MIQWQDRQENEVFYRDDKEGAGFGKDVGSSWVTCWEAVEDVAIRSPQRPSHERTHLESCWDAPVILTCVSAAGEAA